MAEIGDILPLIDENPRQGRQARSALEARTLCEAFQLTASERPGQVAHRTLDGSVEFTFGEYAERVQALANGSALARRPPRRHGGADAGQSPGVRAGRRCSHASRGDRILGVQHAGPGADQLPAAEFPVSRRRDGTHVPAAGPGRAYARGRAHRAGGRRDGRHDHAGGPRPTAVAGLSLRGRLARLPARRCADADLHVRHDGTAESRATDARRRDVHGAGICEGASRNRRWTRHLVPAAGARRRSAMGHYAGSMCFGTAVTSIPDPRQVGAALVSVRPTAFGGVPRVWEKIRSALVAAGLTDPAGLPDTAKAAVRARIGLDQAHWCISGAAPASPEVLQYFADLGLPVNEGWGMSEVFGHRDDQSAVGHPHRHRRSGVARRGSEAGPRRGASAAGAARDEGLSQRSRRTAEAIDGRLAAHGRHRPDRRGRLHHHRRSQEGDHHQCGRQEHVARQHRAQAACVEPAGRVRGVRRGSSAVQRGAAGARSRNEPRWAAERGLPAGSTNSAVTRTCARRCRPPWMRQMPGWRASSRSSALRFRADWQPGGDELTPT